MKDLGYNINNRKIYIVDVTGKIYGRKLKDSKWIRVLNTNNRHFNLIRLERIKNITEDIEDSKDLKD